jgi:hypothetical protein
MGNYGSGLGADLFGDLQEGATGHLTVSTIVFRGDGTFYDADEFTVVLF